MQQWICAKVELFTSPSLTHAHSGFSAEGSGHHRQVLWAMELPYTVALSDQHLFFSLHVGDMIIT